MAAPTRTTVTWDGTKFDATSASFSVSTQSDQSGTPVMGSLTSTLDVVADLHDTTNLPFGNLKKLFEAANLVTKDKIKDVKVEFWQDDAKKDVVCSYAFKGWISHLQTHTHDKSGNNTLVMSIQPVLDTKNFGDVKISN
jgi:enamine deaminase RidA (YjgF/YER057c/UK114 family)